MAMLEVKNLEVYYGVIQALKGISFEVNQGEIIALIGANGAGKTTTLHTITGLLKAKTGSIVYNGMDVTKTPGYKLVGMGLAHVPEGRRIFATLTVLQNLKMGAFTRKDKAEIDETLKMIYKRFPRLEERKNQMAGTLSGGEQQMLAMGRALMSHPKMIVMDEPSMGLSPIYVNEIFDIIQSINSDGTTVLLVEQNAKKALSIADRAYVLETGTIALSGDAKELMNNDQVKRLISANKNYPERLREMRIFEKRCWKDMDFSWPCWYNKTINRAVFLKQIKPAGKGGCAMLDQAIQIAETALAGMKGPDEGSYFEHARRVMEQMDTEEEKTVAILHDVVEDGDLSLKDLQNAGFPRNVVEAVGQLTKRPDMTYFEYIDDISCNPLAAKVKIAEILDNQDEPRVKKMSFCTFNLEERMKRSLEILKQGIEANTR